jgi:integrase
VFESPKRHHFPIHQHPLQVEKTADVSLKRARILRDEAREAHAAGLDPAFEKQKAKAAARISAENSFSKVAELLLEKQEREGLAEATIKKRRWFIKLVFSVLGRRSISEIQPMEVLLALRPIEKKGRHESAKRALNFIGQVFRYAVASQLASGDPTRDLRGALTIPKTKHHAAILDPERADEMLRAIDGYEGQPLTRWAVQLSAHLFVRPGELRKAEWAEIDAAKSVWRIPPAKMKGRVEHQVSLSRQALAILTEIRSLTGRGKYVFPSIRSAANPMSENTVNAGLRRLGYSGDEMTAHGFRSMASTLLNECGKWHPDAIERSLAHKDHDSVRAAYARGAFWNERVEMAQWWSDYLDRLKDERKVLRAAFGQ